MNLCPESPLAQWQAPVRICSTTLSKTSPSISSTVAGCFSKGSPHLQVLAYTERQKEVEHEWMLKRQKSGTLPEDTHMHFVFTDRVINHWNNLLIITPYHSFIHLIHSKIVLTNTGNIFLFANCCIKKRVTFGNNPGHNGTAPTQCKSPHTFFMIKHAKGWNRMLDVQTILLI